MVLTSVKVLYYHSLILRLETKSQNKRMTWLVLQLNNYQVSNQGQNVLCMWCIVYMSVHPSSVSQNKLIHEIEKIPPLIELHVSISKLLAWVWSFTLNMLMCKLMCIYISIACVPLCLSSGLLELLGSHVSSLESCFNVLEKKQRGQKYFYHFFCLTWCTFFLLF